MRLCEMASDLAPEFFLQFRVADLDHRRAAVRAAVGQFAPEEILHEAQAFRFAEDVVRLHRVAADGLGDHVLAETQLRDLLRRVAEFGGGAEKMRQMPSQSRFQEQRSALQSRAPILIVGFISPASIC